MAVELTIARELVGRHEANLQSDRILSGTTNKISGLLFVFMHMRARKGQMQFAFRTQKTLRGHETNWQLYRTTDCEPELRMAFIQWCNASLACTATKFLPAPVGT